YRFRRWRKNTHSREPAILVRGRPPEVLIQKYVVHRRRRSSSQAGTAERPASLTLMRPRRTLATAAPACRARRRRGGTLQGVAMTTATGMITQDKMYQAAYEATK